MNQSHNHLPNIEEDEVERLILSLEDEVVKTVEPIQAIYDRFLVRAQTNGVAGYFPSFESIRGTLYNKRRGTYPSYSGNAMDLVVDGPYSKTLTNEDFLMIDHTYISRGTMKRLLVFSTRSNLERLSECDTWAVDGTFKSCPKTFSQLYNIYGFISGKSFPLVFGLLENKDRVCYTQFFGQVKMKALEFEITLTPSNIILDFERASFDVLAVEFAQARLHSCMFHFGQAIYRRVVAGGWLQQYNSLDDVRIFFRSIMSIGFLPSERVLPVFELLLDNLADFGRRSNQEELTSKIVEEFGTYFRRQWLCNDQMIQFFNVFDKGIRTNNSCEGWHSRINRIIKKESPNIFELIKFMREEQACTEAQIEHISRGEAPRKRRKYLRINDRIQALKNQYQQVLIDEQEFLRRISYCLKGL